MVRCAALLIGVAGVAMLAGVSLARLGVPLVAGEQGDAIVRSAVNRALRAED